MNSDPNLGSIEDCVDNDMVPGTNRHKPFRSPNPTPYQLSPMSLSQIDTDSKESAERLFGQRDPFYPIAHEKPEHRVVLYLKAQGMNHVEIAEATGYNTVTISNICRQPWAVTRITELQRKVGHDEVAAILNRSAPKAALALDRLIERMEDVDNKGRLLISPAAIVAASKEILDRKYGKSKQPMDAAGLANLDMTNKTDEELVMIVCGQGSTITA